jgi:hypothetical protein
MLRGLSTSLRRVHAQSLLVRDRLLIRRTWVGTVGALHAEAEEASGRPSAHVACGLYVSSILDEATKAANDLGIVET